MDIRNADPSDGTVILMMGIVAAVVVCLMVLVTLTVVSSHRPSPSAPVETLVVTSCPPVGEPYRCVLA